MRLLFLTTAPPWPPRRGYQMRLTGLISALADRHEIHVLTQSPPGFQSEDPPARIGLSRFEVGWGRQLRGLLSSWRLPIQVALHHGPGFKRRVLHEIKLQQPDLVIGMLSRLGPALLDLPLPTVVDLIDCLGLNMAQRARREPWLRPFWSWESRRMYAWERKIASRVAATTVVSERDRQALLGGQAISRPPIVVPLGLEIPERPTERASRQKVILLSGNLGYFPTVEGVLWFARKVWPVVHQAEPKVEFWLAGSRPAKALERLAEEPGIRLIREPEDLSEIRQQARVAIAPLRAGSGTPIKILEAMADGLPVVTTSFGQQGLDDLRGGEVLVADSPEDFASAANLLLRDDPTAVQQTEAARRWLIARHGVSNVGRVFQQVLENALTNSKSR